MNELHRLSGIALVALMATACADQNMTNESGPNDLSDQAPSFSAIAGAGVVVGFEPAPESPPYAVGTINGQNDWSSTGSYDQAVVTNAPPAPSTFGTQSLRISNAITSGSFGDQTFSKRLLNAAGETTADENGFSLGGTRQNHFEAQWQFASFVPWTEQTSRAVTASPDRGDGSRMSFVRMTDTPTGLAVAFVDVPGVTDPSDFVETSIASGLSREAPHIIKITMDLVDGESNDVVKVYVDGALKHTGTSWENYYRHDSEASAHNDLTPIVNRILFRAGGTSVPSNSGKGFLIDDFSLKSSMFTGTPCAFTTAGTTMTLVADCTTSESILIPDGFTLDGADHTITAVDPEAPGHFLGAVVRNGGASAIVTNLTVTASGLTDACDGGDDRLRGILLDGASGSITNNTVTGVRQGPSGCQEGNSIEVRNAPFDATEATDLNVTISDNVVSSYQKTGILANGSVAATITGNTITGAGPVGYIAQNGVQVGFGATAVVKDNTVSGNSYTGADVACGILLFQADGVKASSNNLFSNERDMCNFGKGGGKLNPSN
jgi:hypothetical protein